METWNPIFDKVTKAAADLRLDRIRTRRDLIHTCLDLIHSRLDLIHNSARSHTQLG